MPAATATPVAAPMSMQGIAIPSAVVDPKGFRKLTRRQTQQESKFSFTLGQPSNPVALRRSDILTEITLRITGTLKITPGTGTVASTAAWPYGLVRNVRFSANGSADLIKANGWTLRAREIAKDEGLSDRGITQTVGGVTRNQGTLSLAMESWGVGQATPALADNGSGVPIELVLTIPVAEDQYDLTGAVFLQSSSSELTVAIDWADPSELFTATGNGAFSLSGYVQVVSTKYKIPTVNGSIIVPDLSMFHSLVETNDSDLANGENETNVLGQGAGKLTLRIIRQLLNGTPAAPVALNDANFGLLGWRYGTAETPDRWYDGSLLRISQERHYNCDLGGYQGFMVDEFSKGGVRDVVDMGTTADLRLVTTINNSVALSKAKLRYAVETLYASGQAA